jgi:hypothetical protein
MSKDNLHEMYRIVIDITTGDNATRTAAYMQARTAYIALLKDKSVDFSQPPAYDLDVMKHYALRSHENIAVDLAIKGVSGIIGSTQAVKETVQFMADPVAMAKSAAQLVTHPGDVVNQVESAITHPWDTYKGYTMPQRLALAQQLESANSEIGLQAGQAKETALSTINVLTTVAGTAGAFNKLSGMKFPPGGSVALTPEGFIFPVVDAVAPVKIGTVPVAGVMAMEDGSDKRDVGQPVPANPHARLTAIESATMPAEQIELANACLQAIEDSKTKPTQGELRKSVAAYHEYVNDLSNANTSGPHDLSFSAINQQKVSDKIVLAAINASEGASVEHAAKLRMQVGDLSSYRELAIVKSPYAPPFVVAARPVISSANTLHAELGMTYEKINVNAALQMVEAAESVDWVTSYKTGPKDFKSALLQLNNPDPYISPVIKLETSGPIIDNEALLKNVGAPAGSRVLLTINIQGVVSDQLVTQVSAVLPPKELPNALQRLSQSTAVLPPKELLNAQPRFFVLLEESSSGSDVVRPMTYREVSAEEIKGMTIRHNQIESGGENGIRLLKALSGIANDEVSSINPVAEPKTLADAVAHLHPDAQAIVLGYVAAAQSQRDADKQQQQV